MIERNSIIQGDCLDWLDRVKVNSVDLCYIDPPFFTQRNFNDFTDKWNGRDTYLSWIRRRIQKIKTCLKDTGFFVLHCDYRADYKLRVVLEDIFGEKNFRGHVIWKRRSNPFVFSQDKERQMLISCVNDSLVFFSNNNFKKLNKQYISQAGVDIKRCKYGLYLRRDKDGEMYSLKVLKIRCSNNYGNKSNIYDFMGVTLEEGYFWRLKEKTMQDRYDKGLLVLDKEKGQIYIKNYRNPSGVGVGSFWSDIACVNYNTLYSTQKPERLLKRIIKMCTQEGDLVLDCFGGSGTTAAVAKTLGRDYIIGDTNPESIKIMKTRLEVDR